MAEQVGRDHPVPSGKRGDDRLPRPRRLGDAVDEQKGAPIPGLQVGNPLAGQAEEVAAGHVGFHVLDTMVATDSLTTAHPRSARG